MRPDGSGETMTTVIFSSSSPRPQLGDKVWTTDDPATVSTKRRRHSLLVGRVVNIDGDMIAVAMTARRRRDDERAAR